uniref:Retrovirus-related Pol polyprotein from transposon 297 n=1 Tax=Schistocephalus solidus TaxID=70667 RepID=A0A0X3PFY7_SCHSO
MNGIICPTKYSAWTAPIVAVKKPNERIRLCVDYSTGFNDALEDYHYPLPTSERIFAMLNGVQVFKRIDLSEAYLQLPVDEAAQEMLTINTHKGLFKLASTMASKRHPAYSSSLWTPCLQISLGPLPTWMTSWSSVVQTRRGFRDSIRS